MTSRTRWVSWIPTAVPIFTRLLTALWSYLIAYPVRMLLGLHLNFWSRPSPASATADTCQPPISTFISASALPPLRVMDSTGPSFDLTLENYLWTVDADQHLRCETYYDTRQYRDSRVTFLDVSAVDPLHDSQASSSSRTRTGNTFASSSSLNLSSSEDDEDGDDVLNTTTMTCGVCMELFPLVGIVRISPCDHHFCGDCLRGHAIAKLDEGTFPILCPLCSINTRNSTHPQTRIEQSLVETLSLPQQTLDRFTQLQIAEFAIGIRCPRCKSEMFVDRTDYFSQVIVTCPISRCRHRWCKACGKTVRGDDLTGLSPSVAEQLDRSGLSSSVKKTGGLAKWKVPKRRHECKRDGKFDKLMKKQGWRYCPGCRTPIERNEGCNHMTCTAPGCKVHFCYKCGGLMIDATNGGDIGNAVSRHRCGKIKKLCIIQ